MKCKPFSSYDDRINVLLLYFILRCREKQRKEASSLQTVNGKLSAMNKLLMEENERLQKQVSHLVYDNGCMRTQLHTVSSIFLTFLFYFIIIFFFYDLDLNIRLSNIILI